MRKLLKNRLALSTVITTLIILVVSVLLAGVVTYFAINVVSTRVQQESLSVSQMHVWVDTSGNSEAAMVITNTGGRDVVINQIQVRGIAATFGSNVFDCLGTAAPSSLAPYATADLTGTGTTKEYPFGGTTNDIATTTAEPITLSSGGVLVVYISNPTSVSINDIGTTIGITAFTGQAMYYQEANVQATTTVTIGATPT
jgi:hypothetical protein